MIVAKIAVMCPAKRIVINETVFVKLLLPGKQKTKVLFYIDRERRVKNNLYFWAHLYKGSQDP